MNTIHKGVTPLSLDNANITEITINEYNTNTINSITSKYPVLRQDSKAP